MKTIFGALALCGMTFALSGNAAGQTLIGEWQLVKTFCEGGEVLVNLSEKNINLRRIFDKVSTTQILNMPEIDEEYQTKDCALHVKTNYSMDGNQYTMGPFLELTSPHCPDVTRSLQEIMKYSISHLKEKYGGSERGIKFAIRLQTLTQRLKNGKFPSVEYKINDDNRQLWTFLPAGENDQCSELRSGSQYKRIK